jgi:multidrug efflux pump subunit AcrB
VFISDFAIKRPTVTVVSMLALVVFGFFALLKLEVDEFPEIAPPVVSVAIPFPGASPDQVERDVIDPIEEGISSISGLKKLDSQSLDSFGLIVAEFEFGKEPAEAAAGARGADPQAVRSERLPDRHAGADLEQPDRRPAHADRRSRRHQRAARHPQRRGGRGGGRDRA